MDINKAVEELGKKAQEAHDAASAQQFANAALLLTQADSNLRKAEAE